MATARRLRVVVNSLELFIEGIIKKLTLDIVANLDRAPTEGGTPVDTGWARANWIPQIGTPVTQPAGSRTNVSDSEKEAGKAAVVAKYKLPATVYISNNVPYILKLNEGHSKQAPPGFIQANIAKAVTADLAGIGG
jgi:hypothetical protein